MGHFAFENLSYRYLPNLQAFMRSHWGKKRRSRNLSLVLFCFNSGNVLYIHTFLIYIVIGINLTTRALDVCRCVLRHSNAPARAIQNAITARQIHTRLHIQTTRNTTHIFYMCDFHNKNITAPHSESLFVSVWCVRLVVVMIRIFHTHTKHTLTCKYERVSLSLFLSMRQRLWTQHRDNKHTPKPPDYTEYLRVCHPTYAWEP